MAHQGARLQERLLWGLLIVVVVGVSAWAVWPWLVKSKDNPTEDYRSAAPVADFQLTERSGRTVTNKDLHGKVWVAAFVFTRCAGPCKQVSGQMAGLQRDLASESAVILVSITVDPEHDKEAVLKAYADSFGADPQRWLFLTGEQEKVYPLIRESFLLGVQQTQGAERTPGNEVTHSTRLAVVDRQGYIRGYYDGTDPDDLKKLRERVAVLLREKP